MWSSSCQWQMRQQVLLCRWAELYSSFKCPDSEARPPQPVHCPWDQPCTAAKPPSTAETTPTSCMAATTLHEAFCYVASVQLGWHGGMPHGSTETRLACRCKAGVQPCMLRSSCIQKREAGVLELRCITPCRTGRLELHGYAGTPHGSCASIQQMGTSGWVLLQV